MRLGFGWRRAVLKVRSGITTGIPMRPSLLLTGLLMSSIAHAADVPFAAYLGRVADFERKISEYNSEQVSQGFVDRRATAVSSSTPATYTLASGESLVLLFKFTERDTTGSLRPQNPEFFGCDKIVRRIDGKPVTFKDMTGFTWENELISSNEPDARTRGMLAKLDPPLPPAELNRVDAIWKFSAQDVAAFAADAAFSDDANQIAGKILEYLCFHKADDAIPFVVLRLDATTVAAGETWDEKNAREKAARDAAAAERSEAAQRQRATDKAGGGGPESSAPSAAPDARQASTQRSLDAAASRDAANARAQAAADARNAAARERKAALEAARQARRAGSDDQ